MKELIEQLYKFDRYLLGSGYDNALQYLKTVLGSMDILEFPSGTRFGSWTVPEEWSVRGAWVKVDGERIIDFAKDPLALAVNSAPFSGWVKLDELKKHINYSDDLPDATQYSYKFYEKDWAFSMPKSKFKRKTDEGCKDCDKEVKTIDPEVGKIKIDGVDYTPKYEDALRDTEYQVMVDTEFKPGKMKVGVHTIKGKSDREILLFAHLDHPYQANDNLSAVACLVDLAQKIKADHTIKLIFCPETIGSIAYASTQDISKVDFVIAVEICGNDRPLLLQKAFDRESRLNRVADAAFQMLGKEYRKAEFRNVIGSDEYFFNDPKVGIPGILLTRHPFKEYHTSDDTPDKLNMEKIEETGQAIMKIIEIWEKDYIPERVSAGPIMRSRYDMQSPSPQINLNYDYLFYSMDGKKTLSQLCAIFELPFDVIYQELEKIINDGQIRKGSCPTPSEGGVKKIAGKKHPKLSRKTNVPVERREVP